MLKSLTTNLSWMLALLAGFACAGADEFGDELELGSLEQGINNGVEVTSQSAPITSAIWMVQPKLSSGCSGVKIAANRFLTSAHCVDQNSAGQTLNIGNSLISPTSGTLIQLTRLFIHPSYRADPRTNGEAFSSPHSYDVAVIETTTATPNIPAVAGGVYKVHVTDGQRGMAIGYGRNDFNDDLSLHKQRWGASGSNDLLTASQAQAGESAAGYAHQILAVESGSTGQSLNSGDSGGPLFRETSVGSGVWQVMGLNQNDSFVDEDTPAASGFARIQNVSRWIDRPHNNSITPAGGEVVFIQSFNGTRISLPVDPRGQCAGATVASGQAIRYFDCEGYDPKIHSRLWELVDAGGGFFRFHSLRSNTNLCFDVTSAGMVVLNTCSTAQSQQWRFVAEGTNGMFYNIRNRSFAGFSLAANPLAFEGAFFLTTTASGDRFQQWMIYR